MADRVDTPTPEGAGMRLQDISTDALSLYHRNPRVGDVAVIARSLAVNGQYRPVVVNFGTHTGRPLEVLAGNHTLAAARSLGWSSVLCTVVDVDDTQAARIVAADNRTADLGTYDDAVLIELLRSIADAGAGLDGTGYDEDVLRALESLSADVGSGGTEPGGADLDALAAEYGEPQAGDTTLPLTLRLPAPLLGQWWDHRGSYGTDAEAFEALLARR